MMITSSSSVRGALACLVAGLWAFLPMAAAAAAGASTEGEPSGEPVRLTVRLALKSKADLKREDITYADFPDGKRCAFIYDGCKDPKTIKFFNDLGFRTTMKMSGNSKPEYIKELAEAGAEIAAGSYWGAKGGYASIIEGNSIQEAYDAVTTTRLVLQEHAGQPVYTGEVGGHISATSFPLQRDIDRGAGFGAVFHDTNYMTIPLHSNPTGILLGRLEEKRIAGKPTFDNTMDSRSVPNETIYYQILANQFLGTLRRVEKGQVVRYSMRDFKKADLEEVKEIMGPYGEHDLIWHSTEGEIGASVYVREQVRLLEVKAGDAGIEVILDVARDAFPNFLTAPLCLQLPKDFPLQTAHVAGEPCKVVPRDDGVYVNVDIAKALRAGCRMKLESGAPNMSVPETITGTLTLVNAGEAPIEGARLEWIGCSGLSVTGGAEAPFDLAPKAEKKIEVKIKTERGALFGITPVQAVLRGKVGGEPRAFMEGFEFVVAPRLRVDMDPMTRVPMPPGRYQYFEVHLANDKGPHRFLHHTAGPCKGMLSFDLPKGMSAEPKEIPFELKENDRKTLLVKIANSEWNDELAFVKPLITFEGQAEAVETACPGTTVVRKQSQIDYKPLDDKGLLVYAGWDDKDGGGKFDKSAGPGGSHYYPGHAPGYTPQGVKNWGMATMRSCQIYKTWKNIDYMEGTLMFWFRRDPARRNEIQVKGDPAESWKQGVNRGNNGESMIVVGMTQGREASQGGLCLRRYPGWEGKDGYLELVYQCLGGRLYHCHAPFAKATQQNWHHVAMLWSVKDRRLELYLNGEKKATAEAGETPWYPVPWDPGHAAGHPLILLTTDHGHWSGTTRDEIYIYNRALTAEDIKANMGLAKPENQPVEEEAKE